VIQVKKVRPLKLIREVLKNLQQHFVRSCAEGFIHLVRMAAEDEQRLW
jgi:hypothetical protein